MSNVRGTPVRIARQRGANAAKPERSRGQILILFVMALVVFAGMIALVIDVSWYWVNSLKIQRAADAAALAGVVQLPTNPSGAGGAYALARAEATKNGYAPGDVSVTIVPLQEPAVTGRRLAVTITAPVPTFFMRILGIEQIMSTRVGRAEYVLPVPMGSPDNYYGVFGEVRGRTVTETVNVTTHPPGDSGMTVPTASLGAVGSTWTSTNGTLWSAVDDDDGEYAQSDADGDNAHWSRFNLLSGLQPDDTAMDVNGIVVELTNVSLDSACADTFIEVALSYDGGSHWTTSTAGSRAPTTGDLTTTATDYTLGSTSSLSAWQFSSGHAWTGDDLGNTKFGLRLTANKGCGSSAEIQVDRIEVHALYEIDRVTPTLTTTTLPDEILGIPGTPCPGVAACFHADGSAIPNPNGFWGTMNTQGAENVDGDAYQPYYDDNSPADTNPAYDAEHFYNYAVEMPRDSTGGAIYVFDPVFCATQNDKGTGDRWFSGDGDPVSSFYELWDTRGTLHDIEDDILLVSSDDLFRSIDASDTTMGGPTAGTPAECRNTADATYGDGRDYHNNWYLLASGLSGGPNGAFYRIHTTSTDPANVADQRSTDGENSFALYVGGGLDGTGTPRIYGIGAMQAFTPLKAAGSSVQSEFYLAQIDAVHAGKTVEIKLWDPGDTNPLSASLAILVPNSGGWSTVAFDYSAARGTTNSSAANCDTLTGDNVSSVQTNVGVSSGTFNGCWLTILVPIPSDYTGEQDGWWRIRYTMNGNGTSNDVTTWKVAIKGNPVHLIVP